MIKILRAVLLFVAALTATLCSANAGDAVIVPPSTNATLTTITTTPKATLRSTTGPGYRNYTALVANSISSIQITPTAQDTTATITISGQVVTSGTLSQPIPLNLGANTITIVVTAQDGVTVKNYIITATRAASPIATLSDMVLSTGTLSPAFAPATANYNAIVPNAVASITLTPTVSVPGATVKVNGAAVASGSHSAALALGEGDNIITTVVTAADGIATKTYTTTVTRAAANLSANAILTIITTTPKATLTSATGPGYRNYTASVANSTASIQVTPTAQDATAGITVNGQAVVSGSPSGAIALSTGANTITIAVTAQDGATIKNYVLSVTRAQSGDATLSNIVLGTGTLGPVFSPATTTYNTTVPNATASIKITPTATEDTAAIKVNGQTVVSGSASPSITLVVGNNAVPVVVTAPDGTTTKTYTLNITRAASNLSANALISGIALYPKATLTAATGPGYRNYTVWIPNYVNVLEVDAGAQDANATVTINGQGAATNYTALHIPLNLGANTITIRVTAQDGATTKDYIITATRALTPDVTLSKLTMTGGSVSPAFSPAVTDYSGIVPNQISSISLKPIPAEPVASVKVNGVLVNPGFALTVQLHVGLNTLAVVVTAPDGVTTKTYTIRMTRAAEGLSVNSQLSSIALSPSATLTPVGGYLSGHYTTSVPGNVSSVQVIATTQESTATIKVNGQAAASGSPSPMIPLHVGNNIISIQVTAQDLASVSGYTIEVNRDAAGVSTVATLSGIGLSWGTLNPVFAPATTGYSVIVPDTTPSIRLTPTVTGPAETVKINGVTVAPGVASASLPLAPGSNIIITVVTAPDGITSKTYTVTVTRLGTNLSANALLGTITLTPKATLTASTGPGYRNYTASVANSVSSIQVTPTAQDATATITVNGQVAASGALSQAIPLNTGANVITTTVTAQNGTTINRYIITVTRAPSANAGLTNIIMSAGYIQWPPYPTVNFPGRVPYAASSIRITVTASPGATVKVNSLAVAQGAPSQLLAMSVGDNPIPISITSEDGSTVVNYVLTVTRVSASLSANALLSSIALSPSTSLTASTGPGYRNYTATVPFNVTNLKATGTPQDPSAVVTLLSDFYGAINPGVNTITIRVSAQDQVTFNAYIITVTRQFSPPLNLLSLALSSGTLSPAFNSATTHYSATVPNAVSSVTVTATVHNIDDGGLVEVNGFFIPYPTSHAIPLSVGTNTISTVTVAPDGFTTKTYEVIVTREAPPGMALKYEAAAVAPVTTGIAVHQGLSPNGDGTNDVLIIDGITNYPDNTLQIMDRSGQLVYQVKGYDNVNKAFDGQSNIAGKLQPAGTYFYSLQYKDGNETKHKTGYIVLKY